MTHDWAGKGSAIVAADELGALRVLAGQVAEILEIDPAIVERAIAAAADEDWRARRSDDGWHLRPDLPGPAKPRPLPVELLPSALLAHVVSVAGATQTAPDLGALLGLVAISAAVAGKVRVLVDERRDWHEPPNIYAVAILPSGSRKSAVFERFVTPLRRWEQDRGREIAPLRRAAHDRVKAAEDAHGKAVKSGDPEELAAARARLDQAVAAVPREPRAVAADATPEKLVQLLAENGGRLALLAPEGDPLRIASGRYEHSGAARLSELAQSWSGEALRVDRMARGSLHVPRPALTLGLTLQPSALETLDNRDAFRGEGLFARILWLQPDPMLGNRLTGAAVPSLDRAAAEHYRQAIESLLDVEVEEDQDKQLIPRPLGLDSAAREALYRFEEEVEDKLGPGGALESMTDWAGKAPGQAVRIAALLELFGRASTSSPLWGTPIRGPAMEAGIELVRALTSHALAVLGPALDSRQALFQHVLDRAAALPPGGTLRDLFERVKGRRGLGTMDELSTVFKELCDRGCARLIEVPRDGPGRPPSPIVEAHPSARTIRRTRINGNSANSANRIGGTEKEGEL